MPPDLNTKKSWNPTSVKNLAKKWKLEHDLLQAHKDLQQREQENQKEREKSDLLNLSGNREKKDSKINWIYQGDGQNGSSVGSSNTQRSAKDDFLLGKKRVDELVLQSKTSSKTSSHSDRNASKLDKILSRESESVMKDAKEISVLSKDDPMYALKAQQEKRKQILEMQKEKERQNDEDRERRNNDKDRSKDRSRHSHHGHSHSHSHSHSHRDRDRDRDRGRDRHSSSRHSHTHTSRSDRERDRSKERSIKYRER